MTQVDQFESVFRSAAKTPFRYEAVEIGSVLVVSDLADPEALELGRRVRTFLSVLDRGENVRWKSVGRSAFESVPELLAVVEEEQPGLVCTYRHLRSDSWRWPYTLGEYVDVLTQVTSTPILVFPHPERRPSRPFQNTDRVMAMTDHMVGDDRLVNWAARFTAEGGRLTLTHVEDEGAFARFIDAVGKVPSIDTDEARERIHERLVKDAHDFIVSCETSLKEADMPFVVDEIVARGHRLQEYQRLIEERETDLLVMNTKDEDQLAMHGLAYPLAIEVRSIPLLLL